MKRIMRMHGGGASAGRIFSAAAAVLFCCAAPAAGQSTPTTQPRATAANPLAEWHVIKRFDFDEVKLGNEGSLPMYWYRFKGSEYPDFPRFAIGQWDRKFGCRSNESFRLELNGGNVGFYYQPNTISILPGQDIRVEAMVRTTQLAHARAVLEVSFNDAHGDLVAGSRRRTELIGGPGRNDRWYQVSVTVPGKFPTARYVNLNVFLLQSSRWRTIDQSSAGKSGGIDYVDVDGKAWFDDIVIFRLPRVAMNTGQPAQLVPPGGNPEVTISIEGFANQPLEAELSIRDATGHEIGRQVFRSSASDSPVRTLRWSGQPLSAGLYRAELSLYAGGARRIGLPPLLVRSLTFAQLAAVPARDRPGRNFGLVLDDPTAGLNQIDRKQADELALACGQLNVGLVKLPLWRSERRSDRSEQADDWTEELVSRLGRMRVGLVGVFGQIPGPLLDAQAGDDSSKLTLRRSLLDVLSGDPADWRPHMAEQLSRHAEQIRYWQIGPEDEPSFPQDERFVPTLNVVRREFGTLLTEPRFLATWPASFAYHRVGSDGAPATGQPFPAQIANIYLSSQTPVDSIFGYINTFAGLTPVRPWATVQSIDASDLAREPRLADLAWRLTMAAAGVAEQVPPAERKGPTEPGSVFVRAPWAIRDETGNDIVEPAEDLLVVRTIANLLSGCRYGGPLELAGGVTGHIFDRGDGTGVLAVRNDSGQRIVNVRMFLGSDVQSVDIWGNRQPIANAASGEGTATVQEFTAGRLPFFLDNIDPRIARIRASFKLDPPFVPSSYRKHSRRVTFTNPFTTPISGRITLHFPDNWEVHPRVMAFTAQAGERFTRDIEIRFPYNAQAGSQQLLADFVIDADRAYRVQIASRFDFGLGDVEVNTMTQWLPDDELMVTMNVTNRSDGRLDLFCFVVAPNQPRQERVIAALPPGATAIKSFRISEARGLAGKNIRVGLREVKGSRIVNYDIAVK